MRALWTDLYELNMAASYLRRGMDRPATFSLVVPRLPPSRGFLVAAGLADCLAFLEDLRFEGVSADAPYLDSVYKLVEYDGRPVMKLAPAKVTAPGAKQVSRRLERAFDDIVALRDEPLPVDREGLLVPVIAGGRRPPDDRSAWWLSARQRPARSPGGRCKPPGREATPAMAPAAVSARRSRWWL